MARESSNRSTRTYEDFHPKISKELIRDSFLLVIVISVLMFLTYINGRADVNSYYRVISINGTILLVYWLTMLIERLLKIFGVNLQTRYRTSFLSSVGLGWSFLITSIAMQGSLHALGPGMIWGFLSFYWILFSSFFCVLLLTDQQDDLMENNFPPSDEVALQVYLRHERWIGPPKKTNLSKRLFDILASAIGLWLSSPVWLLSALLIWLEDPGPLLFVKNSVGKDGINFRQYKFRTMIRGAEEDTGPVLSSSGDHRVLLTGKFLRKTALDELPQLVNIFMGEMSFVGPRPQRTVMVHEYLKVMPEYAQRHRVLPGLAGLAQVVGHYYLTPRQKLRLDRIYIYNANLGFDLLLIWLSFLIAFWYRWLPNWSGRLPRWLLHGNARD